MTILPIKIPRTRKNAMNLEVSSFCFGFALVHPIIICQLVMYPFEKPISKVLQILNASLPKKLMSYAARKAKPINIVLALY